MSDTEFDDWFEWRQQDRAIARRTKFLEPPVDGLIQLDASTFFPQISSLAVTITNRIEREGYGSLGDHNIVADIGTILRQLTQTYNLLGFLNADDTRLENHGYRRAYSFVSLPLVRTMIDGFYNCTALLDDPRRSRAFRVSGYYRMREVLEADEARHGHDLTWKEYLTKQRENFDYTSRVENITIADIDDKKNKWPLLGEYLRGTDTPHKQTLRILTLGFWKEYSSVSHASYDGLVSIFPYIAKDRIPHEHRDAVASSVGRKITIHIGRAAGLLTCLLTEIQAFCKFDGDHIDQRLQDIWQAIIPMLEIRELYDYRYKSLLRKPKP